MTSALRREGLWKKKVDRQLGKRILGTAKARWRCGPDGVSKKKAGSQEGEEGMIGLHHLGHSLRQTSTA